MPAKRTNIIYGLATIIVISLISGLLLALKPGNKADELINKPAPDLAAYAAHLHPGYLVLRTGNDATSDMIRHMSRENTTYSHAGIVVIEHGYPFIYHCIGGENNWNNALRKDSFSRFVSPKNNLGFAIVKYDLDAVQVNKVLAMIKDYTAKHPGFDLDFDLRTDDKLYCSEMIYKALIKATGDTGYIATTKLKDLEYIAIDNLFMNKHASVVCELRY